MSSIHRIPILVVAVAFAACGPAKESGSTTDSAAGETSLHAVQQTGATLADRGEAQPRLDSARIYFLAKDSRLAAEELTAAAVINREHSANAIEPAKTALLRSADELDRLAARLKDNSLTNVAPLDSAFARVHMAEVQHHCTQAEAAWALRRGGETGAEMLMLVDHFERGARDAGYRIPSATLEHMATVRSIAVMLAQTGTAQTAEVEQALTTIDKDVHVLIGLLGGSDSK